MSLAPVAPLHNRLGELAARHPRLWYLDHIAGDRDCWCAIGAADQTCDLGEALLRLSRAPELRRRRCWCLRCGGTGAPPREPAH